MASHAEMMSDAETSANKEDDNQQWKARPSMKTTVKAERMRACQDQSHSLLSTRLLDLAHSTQLRVQVDL